MSTSTPPESEDPLRFERKSLAWLTSSFEVAASLVALCAIWALLINKVGTVLAFFGETPSVTSANVSTYHRWLLRLAIAVAVTFIASMSRNGLTSRWLYWHSLVLLAGLFAAVAFQVSVQTPDPDPVQHPRVPVCLSGGSNSECVGG